MNPKAVYAILCESIGKHVTVHHAKGHHDIVYSGILEGHVGDMAGAAFDSWNDEHVPWSILSSRKPIMNEGKVRVLPETRHYFDSMDVWYINVATETMEEAERAFAESEPSVVTP